MSKRMLYVAALALGLTMASHARADEFSGPYLGASIGQATLSVEDTPFHETDTGFKGFVGYAFSDLFAIEAAYIDAGTPTLEINGPGGVGEVAASLTGINASILLRARKGSAFAFFVKLGYAQYEVE